MRQPLRTAKERLWKHVRFDVEPSPEFKEHGLKLRPRIFRAAPHCGFTEAQMDEWIMQIADSLEKQFPNWEFRFVQLGANRFKFVYVGEKKATEGALGHPSVTG